MGFCSCTSKFILYIFNLACFLLGLAVLGVGVYAQVSSRSLGDAISAYSIVLIVFGAAVTLISFLGCWGAIQENRCFLHIYGTILLILLLGLIALGAVILIKKGKAEEDVLKFVRGLYDKQDYDEASKKEIDLIQELFECCGLYGYSEYSHRYKSLPLSCCKSHNNGESCDLSYAYKTGCETRVKGVLKTILDLMGIFAIVVGTVELLAVFMAFFLAHSIRRESLRTYS